MKTIVMCWLRVQLGWTRLIHLDWNLGDPISLVMAKELSGLNPAKQTKLVLRLVAQAELQARGRGLYFGRDQRRKLKERIWQAVDYPEKYDSFPTLDDVFPWGEEED